MKICSIFGLGYNKIVRQYEMLMLLCQVLLKKKNLKYSIIPQKTLHSSKRSKITNVIITVFLLLHIRLD